MISTIIYHKSQFYFWQAPLLTCISTKIGIICIPASGVLRNQSNIGDGAIQWKLLTAKSCKLISQKSPLYKLDWVLNTPLPA